MDTNQLKNKLARFETLPPEGAWDKLVERLERSESFAERLYQYEETPSLRNWTGIEKTLDQPTQPAKVISFGTRFKRPIRYVAAASIIGVILITATLFMKRTEAGSVQAGSKTTVPTTPSLIVKNGGPTTIIKQSIEEKDSIKSSPTSLQTVTAFLENRISASSKKSLRLIQPDKEVSASLPSDNFIPAHADKKDFYDFSLADNYMVCSDDDGHAMKLPKKLFSLVQCKDGDGSCKERIRQLQQKLASPAITADFSGVLEMLQQLQ